MEQAELQNLVKELDGMKNKDTKYNDQNEKIKDLKEKVDRTSQLCDCMEQEMDEFFLFAEYIEENWSTRKNSKFDLGCVYMT